MMMRQFVYRILLCVYMLCCVYRIQDYYRKLQEKQRTQPPDSSYTQQSDYGTYPRGDRLRINPSHSHSQTPPPVPPHGVPANHQHYNDNSGNRAEQLANIRAQHQRRHHERQGQHCTSLLYNYLTNNRE